VPMTATRCYPSPKAQIAWSFEKRLGNRDCGNAISQGTLWESQSRSAVAPTPGFGTLPSQEKNEGLDSAGGSHIRCNPLSAGPVVSHWLFPMRSSTLAAAAI
jgi:hypothetical protein